MATLRFAKLGIVDRKQYADQLSRDFDLMWLRSNEEISETEDMVVRWDVANGTGDNIKIGNTGSALQLPVKNEDTDAKPFAQPAPGYNKTITLYPYRQFVRVTDNMMRMQRYNMVSGMVSGMPNAAKAKRELLRVALWNGAFSGTDGSDSFSLCYDSHPHENPEMGTWDNLTTGPLGVDNLHAARLLGQKMKNEWGRPMPVKHTMLAIPPDLERTAQEIRIAKFNPENALNQPNVLITDLSYKVVHNFSSTTAWFVYAKPANKEEFGIYEAVLMDPSVDDDEPGNVDIVWQKRIKFIVGYGFTRTKYVIGSAGT